LQPEKQTDTKQEAKRLSSPKQLSFVAVAVLLKENSGWNLEKNCNLCGSTIDQVVTFLSRGRHQYGAQKS